VSVKGAVCVSEKSVQGGSCEERRWINTGVVVSRPGGVELPPTPQLNCSPLVSFETAEENPRDQGVKWRILTKP
jgi:hypothetical protein